MLCVCCVLTGCIHIFIYVVRCMGKSTCFFVIFMGLLPLGFLLYVWGIFKFVFSRLSHFCSDEDSAWRLGTLHFVGQKILAQSIIHEANDS
jgi:hypothetical protein